MFDKFPKEVIDAMAQKIKENSLLKRLGEPAEVSGKLW